MLNPEALGRLAYWINERQAIYMRKEFLALKAEQPDARMSAKMKLAWDSGGGPYGDLAPNGSVRWSNSHLTTDPIMRTYRFCNVYRELDRVTVWIRQAIREPYANHPHLWYMLAAARYINWPDTLQELMGEYSDRPSWPNHTAFTPEKMTTQLELRRAAGMKVETGAYMIRAESDPKAPWYSWSKQRYVSEVVLGKLWEKRDWFQHYLDHPQMSGKGLEAVWNILQDKHYTGWGPFMSYQWVVDMRWTRYLRNAPDIQTWAAIGPGSARGLNRLHDRDVKKPVKQEQALAEMIELREALPSLLASWVSLPDLSDIQNCLCEYDKWERVRLGEGRPRSMYVPGRGW